MASNCCDTTGSFPNADMAANIGRNYQLIWAEICAIQHAILDAINGCTSDPNCPNVGGDRCAIVNDNTPMTFVGAIENIAVTSGGSSYEDPLIIIDDTYGIGAEAIATVDVGVITSVTVLNGGSNYSQDVTATAIRTSDVTIPEALEAVFEVTAKENAYCSDPYSYYMAHIGQSDDAVIIDQLDRVTSHFVKMGYDVTVQVNPDTQATIQWQICW